LYPAEAKRWVNVVVAAAEKGDVEAQFVLGQLHSRRHMPYERDQGLRWTVLAALFQINTLGTAKV
jgi:hypothetical protein